MAKASKNSPEEKLPVVLNLSGLRAGVRCAIRRGRRVRWGHVSLLARRSDVIRPQHVAVWSLRSAHECELPTATAM